MNPLADTARAFDLSGRVAVVTGGARGIGRAIAEALAAHGAAVVLADRDGAAAEQTCKELVTAGAQASWIAADVTRESDVEAAAAQAVSRHGKVDVLVNNAGISPYFKRPENITLAEWQQLIDVNLTGVFLCCRAFGQQMLAAGGGAIINLTSVAGNVGLTKTSAYCASKAGVELMSRSLALDWAAKGVRVNCIAPGFVMTDMTHGMRQNSKLADYLIERIPLRRFASAPEIASAAVFLASRAAGYITGQTIVVDGGWSAQ